MESAGNDTLAEISSIPTDRNRCRILMAIYCIVVSTLVFFASVATIVWLFEHNLSYKYAVVCFMVGSGILYIVAFTSSLLLLTRELPKRPRLISIEEPHVCLTDCVQNEVGSEIASDISFRGEARLLQLHQRDTAVQTPPPPYIEPSGISTSVDQVQSTGDSNTADNSLNRFYYVLNRDAVQDRVEGQRRQREPGFDMEMQTMVKSQSITRSLNHSNPITNALKRQIASNSCLSESQVSTSSENSPRSVLKVKRNPSQSVKRKLKATLSMSHPDLHSAGSQNTRFNLNPESIPSRSDCNGDTQSLQASLNPQGTPRIARSNAQVSQSVLSLGEKQRVSRLDCNEEIVSLQSNLNPQGTPRIARSNAQVSQTISNLGEKQLFSRLDGNEEIVSSQSNLNPLGTPKIPPRPTAQIRTSQSNLNPEGRLQAGRSDWNEETKPSISNLRREGTPRLYRSNKLRTSQMNLIPDGRLQTSQSSSSVDQKNKLDIKLESLSTERKQLDSKLNYLVSTDRHFTSHSNLHLNTQQSNSNANSYGLQCAPQVDTNSSASLNIPRSNMIGEYLKLTSQPLRPFQKLLQPKQFVACSENVPKLQKAQSFSSLSETHPLKQVSLESIPKRTNCGHLPNASSIRQMSGRSIESVLDATTNSKQMTPREWIMAWNQGFHKLPANETEKVVGVRI